MTKKLTPNVRFKGFSDDWEQRKLGEVLRVNSGKDYKHLESGNIPVYGTGGKMLMVNDKLSSENAIGIGRKGTIDHPLFLKAPFWTVDTLFFMTKFPDNDLLFLYALCQKIQWKKYDESTGVPSLSKSTINKIDVLIPQIDEQTQIGNLFNVINATIASNQKKVDQLKQLKKLFLQKIFSQEWRFKGFTDPWEQRKLGELVTPVQRVVAKPNNPYTRISIRSHAKGTFHTRVEDPKKVAMDKLYIVKKDDLIVNITFAWEHAIAIAKSDDDGLLVSHRFPTYIIDKADIQFVHFLTSLEIFRHKMALISPGGAGRNRVLNKKDFLQIKIFVPNKLVEEEKIGQCLDKLDTLIASNQKKLEQLKQLKKWFLQNMFV
ncbi:restriction endonuclease subunit S [Levilactobacillus spicheri]|uniref:Type I restriction modification DNA specificity domain-containing protein n=1 Tax=Levilactobacillus spicheri TaxID=216463 RepID=A0A0F3RUX1_9LACO|nr:restriction endonuclease subunit S [Levilactobacillus spicheri]KJW13813.1 hypothetical protein VC81_01125 [Levilactobacillus spicheri]